MAEIPSNWLVPLVYTKLDNSAANTANAYGRSLLLGQAGGGSAADGAISPVYSYSDAVAKFGAGTPLAAMFDSFFKNGGSKGFGGTLAEPVGATAAEITLDLGSSVVVSPGTFAVNIGGIKYEIPVAPLSTTMAVATALAAAINADNESPVTAVDDTSGKLTLTAKYEGTVGNQIYVTVNPDEGDELPSGFMGSPGVTYTPGTGDADLSAIVTAMGEDLYDYVVLQDANSSAVDALVTALDDTTGRWSPTLGLYGHGFSTIEDAQADLLTDNTFDSQHLCLAGIPLGGPDPAYKVNAAMGAAISASLNDDPARPLTGIVLKGIHTPVSRQTMAEREALLEAGVATLRWSSDTSPQIERLVTTYTVDDNGLPDNSYQDVQVLAISQALFRAWVDAIHTDFDRAKLVDDGVRLLPGQVVATPKLIKGTITAVYDDFAARGLVEHPDLFREGVVVQRSSTDPNRVEVYVQPNLANQLRVVGIISQFTR